VTLLLACADQLVSPSTLTDHPASSTNVSPTGHVYRVRCNFILVLYCNYDYMHRFFWNSNIVYITRCLSTERDFQIL